MQSKQSLEELVLHSRTLTLRRKEKKTLSSGSQANVDRSNEKDRRRLDFLTTVQPSSLRKIKNEILSLKPYMLYKAYRFKSIRPETKHILSRCGNELAKLKELRQIISTSISNGSKGYRKIFGTLLNFSYAENMKDGICNYVVERYRRFCIRTIKTQINNINLFGFSQSEIRSSLLSTLDTRTSLRLLYEDSRREPFRITHLYSIIDRR